MQSLAELRAVLKRAAPSAPDSEITKIVEVIYLIINEELMGGGQVTERLGIGRSAANMRAWRKSHSMPPATARLGRWLVWTRWDVEEFIAENPSAVRHHEPQEVSP